MKANEITFQIFTKILEKNSALRVAKKKWNDQSGRKTFSFFPNIIDENRHYVVTKI